MSTVYVAKSNTIQAYTATGTGSTQLMVDAQMLCLNGDRDLNSDSDYYVTLKQRRCDNVKTGEGQGQRMQNICSSRRHLRVRHNVPAKMTVSDDEKCSWGGGNSF